MRGDHTHGNLGPALPTPSLTARVAIIVGRQLAVWEHVDLITRSEVYLLGGGLIVRWDLRLGWTEHSIPDEMGMQIVWGKGELDASRLPDIDLIDRKVRDGLASMGGSVNTRWRR